MNNGYLKLENNEWRGKVTTLHIDMPIKLVAAERRTENAPAFDVFSQTKSGSAVKVGVAFEKRMKDSNEAFYSITIDDPSMEAPLYVTAFPSKEDGKFDIVWQRPRKKDAA